MNGELLEQAEKIVLQRASEIAYMYTDSIENRENQKIIFDLCKSCINLGARLFQEALNQLHHETKASNH